MAPVLLVAASYMVSVDKLRVCVCVCMYMCIYMKKCHVTIGSASTAIVAADAGRMN